MKRRAPVATTRRLHDSRWPHDRIIENFPGLTTRDLAAALKATAAG